MNNEQYIERIGRMSLKQLLDHILANPDELTDSYYREHGNAIRARAEALGDVGSLEWCVAQLKGMARHQQRIGEGREADFIYSLIGRLNRRAKKDAPSAQKGGDL